MDIGVWELVIHSGGRVHGVHGLHKFRYILEKLERQRKEAVCR
jgi:hypothetical protein